MANIRHKWMVLMVVAITTLATAQEAVKQYDCIREQANEWATSTLLASLLNTSAHEEETLVALAAAPSPSCFAEERREETSARQPMQLTTYQLIETKNMRVLRRDEALHIAVNEILTPLEMQHVELSTGGRESLERMDEVALLTEKTHDAELEARDQLEETQMPQSAPEMDANTDADEDADAIVHAQSEMHFINRVVTQSSPRVGETDIIADRARAAAVEARIQARATRRTARVLQERAGRPIKIELKIIKKGDQMSGAGAVPPPLRAANSVIRIKALAPPEKLPARLALQDIARMHPDGACASE